MAKTTKKPCRRCWVPTCRNAKPKEAAKKKLFLFPRDVTRCREWIKAIGDESLAETELKKLNTIRFVCEDHFPPSKITPQTRPAADAIPVLFEPQRMPLTENQLIAFDVQTVTNNSDQIIQFSNFNQDSCMSGSSSEVSRSSFVDVLTSKSESYNSLGIGDDPFGSLQSDPSAECDFPWGDLSLPTLDTEVNSASDQTDDDFVRSYNDSELYDSPSIHPSDSSESPFHEDFSNGHLSNLAAFQNCVLDSTGIIIH